AIHAMELQRHPDLQGTKPLVCWKPYSLNQVEPRTPAEFPSVRMEEGTRENASLIAAPSRTSAKPAATGTYIHLCGSRARLSASLSADNSSLYRAVRTAGPP